VVASVPAGRQAFSNGFAGIHLDGKRPLLTCRRSTISPDAVGFRFRPREQVVGHPCMREDRQRGRARRVAPLRPGQCGQIGAVLPSDEEPSGRSLRTLSRGDQMQPSSGKMQRRVLCSGFHQPCAEPLPARAESSYCLSEIQLAGGDRIRPPIRRSSQRGTLRYWV
jgi:hypothetical protein